MAAHNSGYTFRITGSSNLGGRSGGIYVQEKNHNGATRSNIGAENDGANHSSGAGNYGEEHKVKKEKATGTKQKGQRSRTRPHKKEERIFELEKLTKFMVSPQHSMGDGYARRPCNNCWDGKSTRDIDEGVLPTLCTGCETRKGPFSSEQKQIEVWVRPRDAVEGKNRRRFVCCCYFVAMEKDADKTRDN
jgi:hypothetical protein